MFDKTKNMWYNSRKGERTGVIIMYEKDQLCFSCANACGKCSWSYNLVPVDGWTAKFSILPNEVETFRVIKCPKYEFDGLCSRCIYFDESYENPSEWYKQCKNNKNSQGLGDCSGYKNKYK